MSSTFQLLFFLAPVLLRLFLSAIARHPGSADFVIIVGKRTKSICARCPTNLEQNLHTCYHFLVGDTWTLLSVLVEGNFHPNGTSSVCWSGALLP